MNTKNRRVKKKEKSEKNAEEEKRVGIAKPGRKTEREREKERTIASRSVLRDDKGQQQTGM